MDKKFSDEEFEETPIMQMLRGLLSESVREARRELEFDPQKAEILRFVCQKISEVLGDGEKVSVRLHPEFNSGGVELRVESIELDRHGVEEFRDILKECSSIDIEPLTDGRISFSASVYGVFRPKTKQE